MELSMQFPFNIIFGLNKPFKEDILGIKNVFGNWSFG